MASRPDRGGGVSIRWVVEDGAATTLGVLLAKLGADPGALQDGRVFVDRRRAQRPEEALRPGETVVVHSPPAGAAEAPAVRVLERRGGMIAVSKPAGIPTVPDQRGRGASLQAVAARLLGLADMAALHPTSRLDTEVSGVVVFAQGKKARDALRQAREQGRYRRHYVAIAGAVPEPLAGWIDAPIGRGAQPTVRQIGGRDPVPARTRYACVATAHAAALVAAEPATGRTHQIRVHLASRGAPLLGDTKYGGAGQLVLASGAVRAVRRIALHAAWVHVQLDPHQPPWELSCPLPSEMQELWLCSGGDAEALRTASSPLD